MDRSGPPGKGPLVAFAAVLVLPVVGVALGLPLGEWLSALMGERGLPQFWLRGETSHFERKPREERPLPPRPSSVELVRGERGEEESSAQAAPPPPSQPAPAAEPAAPEPVFGGVPASERPNESEPGFRPPRLKRVRMGSGIRSWYQGVETARTETHAFVQAPQAAPKTEEKPAPPAPPPAEPAAPKPAPKPEAAPPPPPPPRRRVPGRTGPQTETAQAPPPAPGEAPGRPGMGEGTASAQAPEAGDRLPPPNPMFDAYPCVTPPAAPQPKVRLTTAEERYDVRGRTAAELTAAMRAALGPGHGPGRTTGEVRASCTYRQEGHLCTPLCSAVVTLRVTLPRWDERGPAELVERWRRFVARVQTHEASHRHLFVAEGNELVKQLGELPRTPCKEVERTVELHSAVLRDQQKQKHRAYDETCKADPSCRLEL